MRLVYSRPLSGVLAPGEKNPVENSDDLYEQIAGEAEVARLIRAAREGSIEAFAGIAERVRPYLLLVANQDLDQQLQAKMGASDIVQQTLLDAQRDIVHFRGASEGELLAWLRRILRNDLLQARRCFQGTGKRQLSREVPWEGNHPESSSPIDVAANDVSPRSEVAGREEVEALENAISQLPSDYRQVLRWRNWEQLSFDEIGRRLGRSAEAARKLWSRAVLRLERELSA